MLRAPAILFSTVTTPLCSPTSNAQGFEFLHIPPHINFLLIFTVILTSISLLTSDGEPLLCLLATSISLQECLSDDFAHFLIGLFYVWSCSSLYILGSNPLLNVL